MGRQFIGDFLRNGDGAVAASYALALTALVAVIGIGFDYAQLGTLDTELQNAADQAALAAATQLDGTSSAITRATTAASSLVVNRSLMANDGGASQITVSGLTFYPTKPDAEADTNATTTPSAAKFARVTLNTRRTRYTLTPVISLIAPDSPNVTAKATAGLGSSICKVPPVMMCNPAENTDPDFTSNYIGKGFRLVAVGGNSYTPGNFGYIDVGAAASGSPITDLKQAVGWASPPGNCLSTETLTTKPGANTPVADALNTRFDIYQNNACPVNDSNCPPSINSVKDLVRKSNANQCGTSGQGWQAPLTAYLPNPATRLPVGTPTNMGHPRDICHAVSTSGDCTGGVIGDGNWDRSTYFSANYPGFNWQSAMSSAYSTTTPTRYQVYRWEIAHSGDSYGASTIGAPRLSSGSGSNSLFSYPVGGSAPSCPASPINPLTGTTDRRTFPVAVVNCTAAGVSGRTTGVPIKKWVNAFLVEPSISRARTQQTDVYVEIVDVNAVGNGTAGSVQVVRRDKPYLVK